MHYARVSHMNMRHAPSRTSVKGFFLAFILLTMPFPGSAESTLSSAQVTGALSPGYMESSRNVWLSALGSPAVQVRYFAEAVDAVTGASVCGTTIAKGTKITFRFPKLQNNDVTWNGTGGAWDTPNGYWEANASAPSKRCSSGDRVSTFTSVAWGNIHFYTPFAINPPTRTISGITGLDCTEGGSDTASCVANTARIVNASFDISSTYGKFYFHTWAPLNTTSNCAGKLASSWFGLGLISPTEPMRKFEYANWDRGTVAYGDGGYTINDGWGWSGAWSWAASTANRGAGGLGVWTGSAIPQPYDVPIPAAKISCPITVIDANGSAPQNPALVESEGSCTVDSLHVISMTATDLDSDQLRYLVDWNADGTIDQFVPLQVTFPQVLCRKQAVSTQPQEPRQ